MHYILALTIAAIPFYICWFVYQETRQDLTKWPLGLIFTIFTLWV